jgi:hypothetical protein
MTCRPRLGVDGRELRPGVRTGIRRYLAEVLRAASRAGWTCIVYGDATAASDSGLPGVSHRVLTGPTTQWWDQVVLPRALARDQVSVFLSPYYKGPLAAPCPVVLTIHFGLAYLARPEGAACLLGLAAAVRLSTLRDGERRHLAWGGGPLLAWLLVAAPYLVYLRGAVGRWTLSGKLAHNLVLVQGTAESPSPLPWCALENAYLFQKYALPELLPGVVAFLVLPGVVARARRRAWLARDGVLLAACLPPFASLAFHIEARFFVPVLPFLLPFVAAGALWVAGALVAERRAGAVALGLTLAVGLAALPAALRPVLRPDPGAGLYPEAARWVAATQPGTAGRRRAERMFGLAGHAAAVERVYREVIRAS